MCLAIPVKITKILPDNMAEVDISGGKTTISLAMLKNVAVGDFVLLHAGFAIAKMDTKEATDDINLLKEISL